jgi:hypothetical protein
MIKLYNDISYNIPPMKEQEELTETIFDFLEHVDAILGIQNMIRLHMQNVKDNGV